MASSCQKKSDYTQIIEQRAKTNIELSYARIHLGDSFDKYCNDNNTVADVKSERLSLPDVSLPNGMGGMAGNVMSKISVEQHNNSNKVDAIVVSIENEGYVQESLVSEYIKKYDMYSYCLISYGYPGSATYREEKLIPDESSVFTPETILGKTLEAKENMNDTHAAIRYVWEWENAAISVVSSFTSNYVYLTFSKIRYSVIFMKRNSS